MHVYVTARREFGFLFIEHTASYNAAYAAKYAYLFRIE
jgi:hypothetical protein